LDLCASPGGKTTLLRSLLHPDSLVVANEVERKRQAALQENLWKWGAANVVVTGSDPADLAHLPETFDLIQVDAPCSGEGLFRKDPFARTQWSDALVVQCATTQRRIVEQAWHALRPGGMLIYSTCTWETLENEDRLDQLAELGALGVDLPLDADWVVVPVGTSGIAGYRCYPHRVRGEGFFLAAVRKAGVAAVNGVGSEQLDDHPEQRRWLASPSRWHFEQHAGVLHSVDDRWTGVLRELQRCLRVLAPGRPVAEQHAGVWRPHAALALDTSIRRGAFPEVPLDRPAALGYLQGAALPATDATGHALAVHEGLPIGWLKGAGSRWNTLWPAPWRIRMHIPAGEA
jgi:precorrin-6B methylase 2